MPTDELPPLAARKRRALPWTHWSLCVALVSVSGCQQRSAPTSERPGPPAPAPAVHAPSSVAAIAPGSALGPAWSEQASWWGPRGHLQSPPLNECSGMVRGRVHPDVYWVHNDSGDTARIFAITPEGALVGEVPVDGARHVDWEDITADDAGNLYIADVGNNRNDRQDLTIYVVREPDPRAPQHAAVLRALRFHYPEQTEFPSHAMRFDCEAVFWHGGRLYLLSKHRGDTQTCLYALDDLTTEADRPLRKLDTCDVESQVTAADVSPDGRELAVLTYDYLYLFPLPSEGEPSLSKVPAERIRFEARQCECIAHEGDRLWVVNEQQEIHLLDTAAVHAAGAHREATALAAFTPAESAPRSLALGYLPRRQSLAVRGDAAVQLPLVSSSGERDEPAPTAPQTAGARVRVQGGGLHLSLSWDALPPVEHASADSGDAGSPRTAGGAEPDEPPVVAYLAWGSLSERATPGPTDQVWAVIDVGGSLALRAEITPAGITPPGADLRRSGTRIEGSIHLPPVVSASGSVIAPAATGLCVVLFAPGGGDWSFGGSWSMRGPLNPFLWGELHP